MIIPAPLQTPLTGTALVLISLSAVAALLLNVTQPSDQLDSLPASGLAAEHGHDGEGGAGVSDADTSACLRLRLLAPAERLTLRGADGRVLLDLEQVAAGESEHDLAVPVAGGEVSLRLEARFSQLAGETAVFLTLLPDALDERSAYLVGTSPMSGTVAFSWQGRE